jgi:hypothetical protein
MNWIIIFNGLQPGQYWYPILTEPGSQGPYNLTVSGVECPPPPPNDNCVDVNPADYPLIEGNPIVITGDNTGATNDCSVLTWAQVWIAFSTTECMNVTLNDCGTAPAQTTLGIWLFTDCPCGGYINANSYNWSDCGDGNWTVHYNALPAGNYYYPFYSAGATGPYTCTVTGVVCPPPPENDNCDTPIAIGDVTNLPFSTMSATYDGGGTCQTAPNLWYVYTASCSGTALASLCGSGYDTKMAVYDGGTCNPLPAQIGCNDDFCGLQS